MIRFALLFTAIGLTGCSQQPAEGGQVAANLAIAPATPPDLPREPPKTSEAPRAKQPVVEPVAVAQPQPPAPPSGFEYPADLGGKEVVKAVTPKQPPLVATAAFGNGPKPRLMPQLVLNPESLPVARYTLPPLLPAKANDVKPGAPAERVPVDLGLLADAIPARPTFPIAAGITERAPDVKVPPPLPILGRPLVDRVSLDDPTAEFGNAAITEAPVKVAVPPASFLKVSLPDPFELGTQVKPAVPPAAEPGLAPVPVNPQRMK